MKNAILAILTVFFFSVNCSAGPFGTEMGDTPEKFSGLTKGKKENTFRTNTLPKTHPLLSDFILSFTDGGLSALYAAHSVENDTDGVESSTIFAKLKEELSDKYGVPKIVIADAPRTSIAAVSWKTNLPDNLAEISLIKMGTPNKGSYFIVLSYEYKNHHKKSDSPL